MVDPDKKEDLIRREAYFIWLAEGKQEGRDQEHWAQAERLVTQIYAQAEQEDGGNPPIEPLAS